MRNWRPIHTTRLRVERGVPIPRRPGRYDLRFPWDDMEPGNSFFVPLTFEAPDDTLDRLRSRMTQRASLAGKRLSARYIVRKSIKKEGRKLTEGVRVWRVTLDPKLRAGK